MIYGCTTPLQGCYKALISTGTKLQKQPSLPDVQPNLTVTTLRVEGKARGAVIKTMENTGIPMENKTELREGPMSTRNQLTSDSLKNTTNIK